MRKVIEQLFLYICRFKKLQIDLQSNLASLQRLLTNIEEFLSLKSYCDQSILQLSTEVLQAKSRASDGGIESVEAAVAELGQVRAVAEDLYNSIVSMDTLVRGLLWSAFCDQSPRNVVPLHCINLIPFIRIGMRSYFTFKLLKSHANSVVIEMYYLA